MTDKKKCVLVAEEYGNIVEIESTISELYRYLKGTTTIIGAIPELDAVIMKCNETPFDLMVNLNTSALPIEERHVKGPILIVRMDENSDHQDLTLSEVEPMLHLRV